MIVEKNIGVQIFMNNKKTIKKIFSVFLLPALLLSGCGKQSSNKTLIPGSSILPAPTKAVTEMETKKANQIDLTGVLTYVNTDDLIMHFVDIDTGTEYEVAYTGGTDIQDKYGKIIAATGTQLGQIYDVTCNKSGKATEIHGSSDAWEKNSLTGVEFDESARRVKQAGSSYVYASYAAVLSNANKINIAQIVAQDEVTLRGVGDTVYSITVDKGHGYITFQGVDAFIGGYASIGTKQLFEVTSGMLTTTQEGTYTVELQKGSLTGTKTVTVARDASVTVDFSEFTTKATQRGAVNFSITPANAVMTIDGVETDYSQPVSLAYGKHRVVLSANGYEQYVETVAVSQAYQTVVIDMTASSATTTAASSTKTATTAANKATTYVHFSLLRSCCHFKFIFYYHSFHRYCIKKYQFVFNSFLKILLHFSIFYFLLPSPFFTSDNRSLICRPTDNIFIMVIKKCENDCHPTKQYYRHQIRHLNYCTSF